MREGTGGNNRKYYLRKDGRIEDVLVFSNNILIYTTGFGKWVCNVRGELEELEVLSDSLEEN